MQREELDNLPIRMPEQVHSTWAPNRLQDHPMSLDLCVWDRSKSRRTLLHWNQQQSRSSTFHCVRRDLWSSHWNLRGIFWPLAHWWTPINSREYNGNRAQR